MSVTVGGTYTEEVKLCGKRRVGDQGMGNGAKGIGKSDYSRRVLTRTRYGKDEL